MGVYTIQTPDGRKLDIEAGDENTAIAGAKDWVSQNPPVPMSVAGEAAAPFKGFNRGVDAMVNLPGTIGNLGAKLINMGAGQAGWTPPLPDEPFKPIPLATLANQGYEPQTAVGRYGEAIGEMGGGAVLPEAGILAKAGSMAPKALERAAPLFQRAASAPLQTAKAAVAPTVGAGIGTQAARDADLGPLGEIAGGLIGGLAARPVANVVASPARGLANSYRYGRDALGLAADPEAAAIKSIAKRLSKADIDPQRLLEEYAPEPSADLAKRGFTASDTAEIARRQIQGESAKAVAKDFDIAEGTARRYHQQFVKGGDVPRNLVDVATEVYGTGKASPVSRLGRAAYGLAGDEGADFAQKLLQRQEEQPGRVASHIMKAADNADYDTTIAALEDQLTTARDVAYKGAYKSASRFDLTPVIRTFRNESFQRAGKIRDQMDKAIDLFFEKRSDLNALGSRDTLSAGKFGRSISDLKRYQGARDALDEMVQGSLKAGEPTPLTRQLTRFRRALNDRVRAANPEYAQADDLYSGSKSAKALIARGEQLTQQLGSRTRDILKGYDKLTPDQQELMRLGFLRKLADRAANVTTGHSVAQRFRSDAANHIIDRLFSGDKVLKTRAQHMVRDLRREAIGTQTVNALTGRGNSVTAPWTADMAQLGQNASAAASFATGNWAALFRNFGDRLSQRIGAATSARIMRILSETEPAKMLDTVDRLARTAKSIAEQKELNSFKATLRRVQTNPEDYLLPAAGGNVANTGDRYDAR